MGGSYTENFDSLPWSGAPGALLGTWNDDATFPGWYASNVNYLRGSDGYTLSPNIGSLYSYGTSTADNALGSQVNGSGVSDYLIQFGVRIVNNTCRPLNDFTLSYFGEQWRDSGNYQIERLSFHYALNAASLTSGDYFSVPDLDFYGRPTALDGNLPENRTHMTSTITAIQWMPGESLWLRWTDIDDPGNRYNSALAVDDLVFSASAAIVAPPAPAVTDELSAIQPTAVPEPNSAALAALSMLTLGLLLRRARKQRG
jgi:hypothetical protein